MTEQENRVSELTCIRDVIIEGVGTTMCGAPLHLSYCPFNVDGCNLLSEIQREARELPEPEVVRDDYSREELIDICDQAVVLQSHWYNRDSALSQRKVGEAWALLRAGCDFRVHSAKLDPRSSDSPATDADTIWVTITYKGFNYFEMGEEDGGFDTELLYLPTMKRLNANNNRDWY